MALMDEAEFQQLDMYENQDTLDLPCKLSPGANIVNLL